MAGGGTVSVLGARGTGEGSDVMSTIVVTTTLETTVEGIFQLMINHRISGVPVVAGGRVARRNGH